MARLTIDQLPEDTAVAGTEWLMVQDAGTSKKMAVSRITTVSQTALDAHVNDTVDAHDATAISAAVSSATINGADVQAQLGQLTAASGTNTTDIAAHLGDTAGAHGASAISTTAIAGVAGADVQAVLAELAARITVLETP